MNEAFLWSPRLRKIADVAEKWGAKPILDVPGSIRVVFRAEDRDGRKKFAAHIMDRYNARVDIRGNTIFVWESAAEKLVRRHLVLETLIVEAKKELRESDLHAYDFMAQLEGILARKLRELNL